MNEKLCMWAGKKHYGKFFQCTSRATEVVDVGGEFLYFCLAHAVIVRRMLKRKADFEALWRNFIK